MNASDLPWWGWLLVTGGLWLVQLMTERLVIRVPLIAAMILSAAITLIRFVKWVWGG